MTFPINCDKLKLVCIKKGREFRRKWYGIKA